MKAVAVRRGGLDRGAEFARIGFDQAHVVGTRFAGFRGSEAHAEGGKAAFLRQRFELFGSGAGCGLGLRHGFCRLAGSLQKRVEFFRRVVLKKVVRVVAIRQVDRTHVEAFGFQAWRHFHGGRFSCVVAVHHKKNRLGLVLAAKLQVLFRQAVRAIAGQRVLVAGLPECGRVDDAFS